VRQAYCAVGVRGYSTAKRNRKAALPEGCAARVDMTMSDDVSKSALGEVWAALTERSTSAWKSASRNRPFGWNRQVPIEHVSRKSRNPRRTFDPLILRILSKSHFVRHGLWQPVMVRRAGNDRYEIIAGERTLAGGADGRAWSTSCFVNGC